MWAGGPGLRRLAGDGVGAGARPAHGALQHADAGRVIHSHAAIRPALRAAARSHSKEAVAVFTLMALVLGVAAFLVLGVLGMAFALVAGIVTLPFRLLGLGLRLGIGLLFLPLLLVLGLFGMGLGLMFMLARLLPLLLIIAGVVWLVRRSRHPRVTNGVRV
jgi:hypothetical protein